MLAQRNQVPILPVLVGFTLPGASLLEGNSCGGGGGGGDYNVNLTVCFLSIR